MEELARKELEAIRGMVLTWKNAYLREVPDDGDADFLVEDFEDEIRTYVYPYVRRLYETNYLSMFEAKEFLDFCSGEVEHFRNLILKSANS